MSGSRRSTRLHGDRQGRRNFVEQDRDTPVAAQCRAIILSEAGIARLTKEILEGDSKTFWLAIERGFGKPSKRVELEPKVETEPAVSLDGVSDNVIKFLAAVALEREQAEQRKSRAAENEVP